MRLSAASPRAAEGFRSKLLWLLLCALFSCQAGAGIFLGLSEMRALGELRGGSPELQLIRATGPLSVGLGQRGADRTLQSCFAGFDALHEYFPADVRAKTAQICGDAAETILKDAPTHGGARQLLAESYDRRGLGQSAALALKKSALAAPNTTWLLRRRLLLLSRLAPEWQAQANIDLGGLVAKLVSMPQSREWLAQAYVVNPKLRALVMSGAASLPEREANLFLARVTQLSAQAGQRKE